MLKRRSRLWAALALIIVVSVGAATAVDASGRPLNTHLTGAEEVPPGDPDGSGRFQGRAVVGQGRLCYTLTVEDIEPAVAAHVHVGAAGVNGPIVVHLEAPATGSSSGCATVDREVLRDIVANPHNYYVNVHNQPYPAGAVRGQLGRRPR